jgi:hypothetical protein
VDNKFGKSKSVIFEVKTSLGEFHRHASRHTLRGERLIRARNSQILSGDFNIQISDRKIKTLNWFFKNSIGFKYVKDPKKSTRKYGTTIDEVFFKEI